MEREAKKRGGWGRETATLAVTIAALAAALLFALKGIRGFAWFAANKEVDASGMSVQAKEEVLFELARVTDYPYPSSSPYPTDNPYPVVYPTEQPFTSFLPSIGFAQAASTSSENKGIIFMLRNEQKNEDVPEGEDPYQLMPGSYGTLEFFIIPTTTAQNLTVTFTLCSKAYDAVSGEYVDYNTVDAAHEHSTAQAELVKGHILFFENFSNGVYSDPVAKMVNGELAFTFTYDVSAHAADYDANYGGYKVTLYWVWPRTFGHIVISDTNDSRLKGAPIFSASAASAMRAIISANSGANNTVFFYDTLWDSPVDSKDYAALSGNVDANFASLSEGYNNGDQKIGDFVDYLIVELTAAATATGGGS